MAGGGAVLGAAIVWLRLLDAMGTGITAGLYLSAGTLLVMRIGAFHPHRGFGLANTLTLTRLTATCLLAGFAAEAVAGRAVDERAMWMLFTLAVAALALDGLDGFAARRLGLSSAFGARFDMEVDAFLILVLSVMAFALNKAGAWVLLSGLLRYAYVAAGALWPMFARPPSPALRRKVIAAIQGCTLAALLIPVVQPPMSAIAAAGALLLLTFSFGIDIVMQARRI